MVTKIKFSVCFAILSIALFFSYGCEKAIFGINGNGEVVSQIVTIQEFTGIHLEIDADVYFTLGDNQTITIEGQQNIIDNIKFEVRNGVWKIDYDKNVKRHDDVKIYITMSLLDEISLSGTGNIFCNSEFTGSDLEINITGTGDIYINESLEYDDLNIDINGTGNIDFIGTFLNTEVAITGTGDIYVEGTTENIRINSTGTGHFNGLDFESIDTQIVSTGSGDCTISVQDNLDVTISGTGDVFYKGHPNINVSITGTGSIQSLN
jgi:hypothetical protein